MFYRPTTLCLERNWMKLLDKNIKRNSNCIIYNLCEQVVNYKIRVTTVLLKMVHSHTKKRELGVKPQKCRRFSTYQSLPYITK